MKRKYRLKKWAVICVYLITLGAIVSSLVLVGKTLKASLYNDETLSYVYHGIFEDAKPVVNVTNDKISKPYDDQKVTIVKNYYDKDGEEQAQQSALIYYENTYMPNTGVLYGSDETFDVISCLDGTVEDITADEIMGNIVTIKNSNNLTTIYQSLNEVKVLVGDTIKQGDVIGTSGSNKIDSTKENMLLFEVSYNGEYINPETFYTKNINELE